MFRKSLSILLIFVVTTWSPTVYAGRLGIICRDGLCQQNIVQRQIVEQFDVVEQVDILQKKVEFDSKYFLGLDGYYDVVNELQAREYVKDKDIILKQAEQLDKLISLLEQALKQKKINNGNQPVTPANPDLSPSIPKPEKQPQDLSDLNTKVFNIFSVSCVSCHGNTSPKKGLQLVGTESNGTKWLNNLSLDKRVLVYDHTAGIKLKERGKKLMPLGGEPLSDADVEILRLWMIAKAEETKEVQND